MKKKCAIFLAATKDSAFAIANVIIGINKHSPIYDDIYIYHDGFSDRDIEVLTKLGNIKFVLYTKDEFYSKVGFSHKEIQQLPPSFSRYTHMCFARYEMFNLLNCYNHVLYFDFDMLIQDDISELLKYTIGMCKGSTSINYGIGRILNDIDGEKINHSSGLISISDKLKNFTHIEKECYSATKKFFSTLRLPDQAILNYVFEKLNIIPQCIPDIYYGSTSHLRSVKCKIIHAYGKYNRFWNNQLIKIAYPEWTENNKLWERLGGTPYNGIVTNEDNIPKLAGYLVQFFDRIQLCKTIMENIRTLTWLPLYPNSNFISGDIVFYLYGVPENDFSIILRPTKQNEITIYIYFNKNYFNTTGLDNCYEEKNKKVFIYKITKNNLIKDIHKVFTSLEARSSSLFKGYLECV